MLNSLNSKYVKQILAVTVWIVIWFVVAAIVDNAVLVASPVDTIKALVNMLGSGTFYKAVLGSVARIMAGFVTGMVVAFALAIISCKWEAGRLLISPVINLCKSVPVAAFAVILIIWWGPANLAMIIGIIVVVPVAYHNILEGIISTDYRLLEMARVFNMPTRNRVMFIYRNALKPYLTGAVKSGIGMCWKAGVAAEVIGLTNNSIGGELYTAKVYFNTAEVFAWALVTVLFSFLAEKLVVALAGAVMNARVSCREAKFNGKCATDIEIINLDKAYDDKILYNKYNNLFEAGKCYTISTESGSGKTTLLHMIAGLNEPDGGLIRKGQVSMVFQEDRLCEDYSAVENVAMTGIGEIAAREALCKVLEPDCLDKPCRELSGGMKRRVAIVRAVEYPAGIVLMDEPFTGMDEETIARVKGYLEERLADRTVVVATHIL